MALLELEFSSDSHKHFNCSTCSDRVKKIRKCHTDVIDYTFETGGTAFPMTIIHGGNQYGFCPGKAQWYDYIVRTYRILSTCCELKILPYKGSLMDQPQWVIFHLSWFAKIYNKFSAMANSGMITLEKNAPKTESKFSAKRVKNGIGQGSNLHNKGR